MDSRIRHTHTLVLDPTDALHPEQAREELAALFGLDAGAAAALLEALPATVVEELSRRQARAVRQALAPLDRCGLRVRVRNGIDPDLPRIAWSRPAEVAGAPVAAYAAEDEAGGAARTAHDVEIEGGALPPGTYRLYEDSGALRHGETVVPLADNVVAMIPDEPWWQRLPGSRRLAPATTTHRFTCRLRDGSELRGRIAASEGEGAWHAFQDLCFASRCTGTNWAGTGPGETLTVSASATETAPIFRIAPPPARALATEAPTPAADEAAMLVDARATHATGRLEEAFRLYQMARDAGAATACLHLGRMRLSGEGCSPDAARAEALFREGWDAGVAACASELGLLLLRRGAVDESEACFDAFFTSGSFTADPAGESELVEAYLLHRSLRALPVSHRPELGRSADRGVRALWEETVAAEPAGGILHAAAARRDLGRIEELLDLGGDPGIANEAGWTPLHCLCGAGNPEGLLGADAGDLQAGRAARLLAAYGADAQAPDGTGRTPLHFAARWRRSVLAAFLLEEGADPNARAEADLTPLHELAGAARLADPQSGTAMVLEDPEGEKTLAILLGRSATPDARDATGATPLHWAVRNGTVLLVDQLLAAGADPAIRDNAGCTPLFVALLRARRTETDATGDADRLLVQCLLDRGAAPDAPGPAGMTPLYFAACIGRMNLVELLLQKGADPDLRTHAGLAPLDRAEAAGNAALAAQLRAAGATDEATGAAYLRRSGEGDAETLRGRMVEEDRLIETLLAD